MASMSPTCQAPSISPMSWSIWSEMSILTVSDAAACFFCFFRLFCGFAEPVSTTKNSRQNSATNFFILPPDIREPAEYTSKTCRRNQDSTGNSDEKQQTSEMLREDNAPQLHSSTTRQGDMPGCVTA